MHIQKGYAVREKYPIHYESMAKKKRKDADPKKCANERKKTHAQRKYGTSPCPKRSRKKGV